MSIWTALHRARLRPEHDEVTCEDCGETFPIKTGEQRERLAGGCPACGEGEDGD